MLSFAALSWHSEDRTEEDVTRCWIFIFGRTLSGQSVCVRVPFSPWFFLEASPSFSSRAQLEKEFPRRNKLMTRVEERIPLYGFRNNQTELFLRLAFDSEGAWRGGKWKASVKMHLTVWEGAVTPIAQFMHQAGIKPASWLSIKNGQSVGNQSKQSICDLELTVGSISQIKQDPEPTTAPVPWVLASWDLETYSPDGQFPRANDRLCPIFQIGLTVSHFQADYKVRYVITSTPCSAVDGVIIYACDGEEEAIRKFVSLVNEHEADVLIAWNGSGFDNHYLYDRAIMHDLDFDLCLSKLKDCPFSLQPSDDPPYYFNIPGVLQYDPMLHLRQQNRFQSYKLNDVAELVCGDRKVDLPYAEIFRLHREGNADDQATIANYCSVDCELPLIIVQRLALIPAILALANATRTPANAILTRGQVRFCSSCDDGLVSASG